MRVSVGFLSGSTGVRFVRLVCVVALAGFLASSRSEACSCMPPGPPAEEFTRADAVFVGKVVSIEPRPAQDQFEELRVTLQMERAYRGERGDRVVVRTAGSSAACGYGFTEGDVYVVYASRQDGALHVSLCSRTAHIDNAGEDLRFLDGQPKLPTEPTLSGSGTGVLHIGKEAVRMGIAGGMSVLGRD